MKKILVLSVFMLVLCSMFVSAAGITLPNGDEYVGKIGEVTIEFDDPYYVINSRILDGETGTELVTGSVTNDWGVRFRAVLVQSSDESRLEIRTEANILKGSIVSSGANSPGSDGPIFSANLVNPASGFDVLVLADTDSDLVLFGTDGMDDEYAALTGTTTAHTFGGVDDFGNTWVGGEFDDPNAPLVSRTADITLNSVFFLGGTESPSGNGGPIPEFSSKGILVVLLLAVAGVVLLVVTKKKKEENIKQ